MTPEAIEASVRGLVAAWKEHDKNSCVHPQTPTTREAIAKQQRAMETAATELVVQFLTDINRIANAQEIMASAAFYQSERESIGKTVR